MKRWLVLLMMTGCVGGLDADLRLGRSDGGAAQEPQAEVALDSGLSRLDAALDAAADASDAADLRE